MADISKITLPDGKEYDLKDAGARESIAKLDGFEADNLKGLAYKDEATVEYTPAGTVSAPTATASPTTTTVNSITSVGTLPDFTVEGEELKITAGTLPTKQDNVTVMTGVTVTVEAPEFSGQQATITVS